MFYKNDMGSWAGIYKSDNHPRFKGDSPTHTDYTLTLYAGYDGNRIYHVSIYETLEEAQAALQAFPGFYPVASLIVCKME